jgi:hypothetical protein
MPREASSPAPDVLGWTYIGADVPLDPRSFPIAELLSGFRELAAERGDVRLALAGKRSDTSDFSIFNVIDEAGLEGRVCFSPYFDKCAVFPVKREACTLWISPSANPADLTAAALSRQLEKARERTKTALLFTSFHPYKLEGNSTVIRTWLHRLRRGGYRVHLVYYGLDRDKVTEPMRARARRELDRYVEVDVTSSLVGLNREGLNAVSIHI